MTGHYIGSMTGIHYRPNPLFTSELPLTMTWQSQVALASEKLSDSVRDEYYSRFGRLQAGASVSLQIRSL
jgi:hypothetical protein